MALRHEHRKIPAGRGRVLRATSIFDTYWRFAAERQLAFVSRATGKAPPWTTDPIIREHRFTNVYRASDRVSQYLINRVIYQGPQEPQDIFFRTLLFKLFNRIDTWEYLSSHFGEPTWRHFDIDAYSNLMDAAMSQGRTLYSAAYIMPSPPFGGARKHRNHLELLVRMMKSGLPAQVEKARSLQQVFELLVAQPSLGGFLAYQFAIDLNYSDIINFSEMDFVVAGPGARDGISKCFADTGGLSEADVIRVVTEIADEEFARLGLRFHKLCDSRPLQLIDCQNVFCELSKYARVAHPDCTGISGRTRIKQKYTPNPTPLSQGYPPKWGLAASASSGVNDAKRRGPQQVFSFPRR